MGSSPMEVCSTQDEDSGRIDYERIDSETQHRYRVFKKNSPFFYDYLLTSPLLWPSLTVQFFPDLELKQNLQNPNGLPECSNISSESPTGCVTQRLLTGSFTSGQAKDLIAIDLLSYHSQLNKNINIEQWNYNPEKLEFECTTIPKTKLDRLQTINHDGDVNKLIYMPQNPDVIASANNVGDVLIYNRTKHATINLVRTSTNSSNPQLRLATNSAAMSEIFAIDWNIQKEGLIVSGSMSGELNVYDIRGGYDSREGNVIKPIWCAKEKDAVNDTQWIPDHDSVFINAKELGVISIYDTRCENSIKCFTTQSPVNSISINPHDSFSLASGNSQGKIEFWDIRSLGKELNQAHYHTDSITQLKWHPKFRSVLGSSSADRLVKIYNMAEPTEKLVFSHEGHMLGVNDFDWSKHFDWMLASVSDDNCIHVWTPAEHLLPIFN